MKREFAFDDSLRMLEVLWSSLPPDPPVKELKLLDVPFQPPPVITPPISPLVKTPRENAYTKVCALRRQSSSISLASYTTCDKKINSVKRQNHSLDETIGRFTISDVNHKHQSLDDAALVRDKIKDTTDISTALSRKDDKQLGTKHELRPRSVSPLEQKSDSVILNNRINQHKSVLKMRSSSLSSSMTNLIKNTKKSGHFKDLKERMGLFSSLDTLDGSNSIKEEPEKRLPKGKMVKNLNEFLNFTSNNKIKFSNKLRLHSDGSEGPKILLTKSSLDDSDSSSLDKPEKPRHLSSASTNSCDDLFDECSPDDSQEYFPMTTSVTREFKIELENLDRQVFGDSFHSILLDSSCDDNATIQDCIELEENPSILTEKNNKQLQKIDDVFLWENPLHKSSPNVAIKTIVNINTPDEQADLEYESELVDESSKTITPIKILNSTLHNKTKDETENFKTTPEVQTSVTIENTKSVDYNMKNSYEEIGEAAKPSSNILPQPCEFGGGNPFLMFLCITVLLQHRDQIITAGMDYNEMAMHFDKMVRKHNVTKVLNQARQMYKDYMKHLAVKAQQKVFKSEDC